MASILFRLKKSNSDFSSIYVRFKQGKVFDTEASTGLETPTDRWSNSKQEILSTVLVNYKDTNKKLSEFKIYLKNEYENTKVSDESIIINNNWLKSKIKLFFNRQNLDTEEKKKIFFTEFIDDFIIESETKRNRLGKPIAKRTIQHYKTTLNKINDFQTEVNTKLKIVDINLKFHTKFIDYLQQKQRLNNNTIGGYIDDVKLFCNNADRKEIKISHEVKSTEFYTPTNSTEDIYLKELEINNIYNCVFEADYLDNARDWFIIGLRTGLRVSDLLNLDKSDIDEDDFISLTTKKTEFPVIIPIHNQVKNILSKRNGDFPRQISDQKFNKYIKIVAEKAGITQMVEGARINKIEITENNKKVKYTEK
ncbi:phage integrase SAM-like domain-containing protein [Flavobacterium oreochromis]|uniref:phage integrase SAM-like domain-containing protein n=1 Tax=Flavobacterium oreochromis TaxID=2906078 RepID=UPI001CE5E682|nr:phage integrase SAM-like domain-containing protein [Flavobacterium oreochromis]QYS87174.1 phage integrase SAM-like domain-containing protein [Flavobacterium oreochromis]